MAFNFEWENIAVVGRGGSSTVYKALVKPRGNYVAVKQIEIDGLSKEQINGIKGEIETMKDLSHTNILCYLGTQQSPNRVFIFLEYADRGSLRQYYTNNGPLLEKQLSYCLKAILAGLGYLHSNGFAHRDIKCANCLLCSDGVVKLADFGASKRFESDSIVSGLKGTPHWMAPEVIKGTQMTTGWMKADVWSLGCTVVEMFTAKVPYAEFENPMTAMYKIASGERPSLKPSSIQPNEPSAFLVEFIQACCAVDPTARPTVEELMELSLVSAVDCSGDMGQLFAAEPAVATTASTTTAAPTAAVSEPKAAVGAPAFCGAEQEGGRESVTAVATHRARPTAAAAAAAAPQGSMTPLLAPPTTTATSSTGARIRSESCGSVMSGDDESTVAHLLDASYTAEDFEWDEAEAETPSRATAAAQHEHNQQAQQVRIGAAAGANVTVALAAGIAASMVGIAGASDIAERTTEKVTTASSKILPTASASARIAAGSQGRSRSRSRNRDINMTINTTSSGSGVDSPAPRIEDTLTPSMHKDSRKTASVKVNMMPMLGQQVSGMSLDTSDAGGNANASRSGKTGTMTRQWSDAELPTEEVIEEEFGVAHENTLKTASASTFSEAAVEEGNDDEVPDETETEPGPVKLTSAPFVPGSALTMRVPSFEAASETYKTMMLKYSPRAADGPPPESLQTRQDNCSAAVNTSSVQANASTSASSTEETAGSLISQESEAASAAGGLQSLPAKDSTPRFTGSSRRSGKKDGSAGESNKTTAPAPGLVQSAAIPRRVIPPPKSSASSGVVAFASVDEASRPYAPLSSEKLRLHGNRDSSSSSKQNSSSGGANGSADVLEKIINQSSAASVRKNAVHEMSEDESRRARVHGRSHALVALESNVRKVKDQPRGKGAQVHHTTAKSSLKRTHDKISPRLGGNLARHEHHVQHHQHHQHQGVSNQHLHGHERGHVAGGEGGGAGASTAGASSMRSQSAGVNLGCDGGHHGYDPRQKLPPVLRGLLRGGVGSSSGSIDPIEEGSGDGAVHIGPVSRYIQSAPAVSRSVTLPPIAGTGRAGNHHHQQQQLHRHGSSLDGSAAAGNKHSGTAPPSKHASGADLGEAEGGAGMLTSQTPKTKQPRLHRFGRPMVPSGVSSVLQQSFAHAVRNHHPGGEGSELDGGASGEQQC